MPLSPVALCSRALLKIGAQPIQSFYDDRVEAEIALALFEPIRDAMLSAYPWRFAVTQATLPLLEDAPLADYDYAFQLPNDCLRVLSIGNNGSSRGTRYRRVGNTLHASENPVILDYIFRPDDESAPAYFEAALMAKLAAEFCLPLTENTQRATALNALAEREFERAKRIDAQQDSPRALDDFILLQGRE